jgi:hypothetical protein
MIYSFVTNATGMKFPPKLAVVYLLVIAISPLPDTKLDVTCKYFCTLEENLDTENHSIF